MAVERDLAEFMDMDGARVHRDAEWSRLAFGPHGIRMVRTPAITDHGDRATTVRKAVDPMGRHPRGGTGHRNPGRALGRRA